MENAVVTLREGEGRALKAGGPWIYDNEAASVEGAFSDGDSDTGVYSWKKPPLPYGMIWAST